MKNSILKEVRFYLIFALLCAVVWFVASLLPERAGLWLMFVLVVLGWVVGGFFLVVGSIALVQKLKGKKGKPN